MKTLAIDWNKVGNAVSTIMAGQAKRVDVDDDTTVYAAGSIIRIDLKGVREVK